MLALVLFTIGLSIVTTTLAMLVTKIVTVHALTMMYCSDRQDNIKFKFKPLLYGVLLTIGIGLMYFFAELAKLYVLLSI